jgi:hypothetical protein
MRQRRRVAAGVHQLLVGIDQQAPSVAAEGVEKRFQPVDPEPGVLVGGVRPEDVHVRLREQILEGPVDRRVVDHEEPFDAEPSDGGRA